MKKAAFTLLELLLIITIVAILTAAMVPIFKSNRQEAEILKVKQELEKLAFAGKQAYFDTGKDVACLWLDTSFMPSHPGWKGPYIDKVRNDSWDMPYKTLTVCCFENKYKVYYYSYGPNKINEAGEGDDIKAYVTSIPI